MTNSPGTVTTDTVSSADDTVRVQVWEPGKKVAEFPSSLSELIDDGEYTLSRKSGVSIICARANGPPPRNSSPSCKQRIIELLGVPGFWLTYACKRSNGYFGSQSVGDGDISSWLRLIAKKIDLVHTTRPAYSWPKMNIVSRWYRATSHTVIVLFDEPADYSKAWTRSILNDAANLDLTNPFSAYAKLSAQFVELQNESVWACRTMVRNVEKQRTSDNPAPRLTHKKLDEDEKKEKEKKDAIKKSNAGFLSYKFMHEASRHTIHVSETVDAGIHVLESIEQSHARFKQAQGQSQEQAQSGWCDFLESLRFSVTMLASLKKRSDSNLQRLENEISLSYNVAAQRDSQASVQIAAAALIFLPSTFVSAVFSTSFFNYDHSAGVWSVSSQFWLYWAVAVPLTVVSILAWVVWNNYDDWMKNRRERDMSKFYAEGK